jgi:plastocyanin
MLPLLVPVLLLGFGCAGDSGPTRAYTLHLRAEDNTDIYKFVAEDPPPIDIRVGDTVTFEMRNDGRLPHDLRVTDDRSSTLGFADAVPTGQTATVQVTFEEPGAYRLVCDVDDHLTKHQMHATVQVTEAVTESSQ